MILGSWMIGMGLALRKRGYPSLEHLKAGGTQ